MVWEKVCDEGNTWFKYSHQGAKVFHLQQTATFHDPLISQYSIICCVLCLFSRTIHFNSTDALTDEQKVLSNSEIHQKHVCLH